MCIAHKVAKAPPKLCPVTNSFDLGYLFNSDLKILRTYSFTES